MSSTGLLFTSDVALMPGRKMEVSISWPAQLNSKTPLQLVTRGTVVRSEHGMIALEIQKHEFHTQSASSAFSVIPARHGHAPPIVSEWTG